ncbi:MAG: CPBP family intramembrane metalloprotease [Ruminococcus sp.]|nr:CPBP family intramembrane metalloprotease [Ruminococcus sp.]
MSVESVDYTKTIPNRFNPFENDTENIKYRDDYRKIVPQISVSGCVIPENPSKFEKKNIRRVYNRTGLVLILHLLLTNVLAIIISMIVSLFATFGSNVSNLTDFMNNSSVNLDIIAITYTIANITSFLIGCKLLNISIKEVFSKPQVTTLNMARHISIAWCFQGACLIVVSIMCSIFISIGFDNIIPESVLDSSMNSITYYIATFIYSCIIAPITEEMLFRGVVLKGFSVVSQRFGIFMSALLFGLLHGNLPQFVTTFCLGIYLGFIATRYNSILPTIVMHFFINLVPTLIDMFLGDNEFISNIILLGFYGIMIVLGIIFICLGFRKKCNRLPVQNALQRKRTLPLAISSIGVIVIVLVYVISMIINHIA